MSFIIQPSFPSFSNTAKVKNTSSQFYGFHRYFWTLDWNIDKNLGINSLLKTYYSIPFYYKLMSTRTTNLDR